MARTMVRGLLVPDPEQRRPDATRNGKGLKQPSPNGERPIESRLLELQSTAGNVAVQRYIQRQLSDAPVVQRDPVTTEGVAETGTDVPARAGGDDGILRYGSRGDDVRTLQERLNAVGAATPALVLDGIFGRKTQRAVRTFQRAHPPLTADGDAGPETLPVLEQAARGEDTPAPTTETPTAPVPADEATPTPRLSDAEIAKRAFEAGKQSYGAGRYGAAYDEFSKAFEITGDPSMLWNRANSLRLLGGRAREAAALYEQFLATNADADEQRKDARAYIDELRGPGRSGDRSLDTAMLNSYNRTGTELYAAGEYAKAYDEFTKAWDVSGDIAMLFNRGQSLRLVGGRRTEAIALFEQFREQTTSDASKTAADERLAELRGPRRGPDAATNKQSAEAAFKQGQEHYMAERYGEAYDSFTIAHEIEPDPAYLFNRAQALRLGGGRRDEAIALYEEFLRMDLNDAARALARERLAELRPERQQGSPGPNAVGAPTPNQP